MLKLTRSAFCNETIARRLQAGPVFYQPNSKRKRIASAS